MDQKEMLSKFQKLMEENKKKLIEFEAKEFTFDYKTIKMQIKGDYTIVAIEINDEIIDLRKKELAEELIVNSLNRAIKEIRISKIKLMELDEQKKFN